MVLEPPRDETEREHRKHHDRTLVEHVDNDISQQLRKELAIAQRIVESMGERGRNALPKIETVQEIGKQGTDAATNQGKRKDDNEQPRDIRKEALVIEEGRRHRNHDADDAVIHSLGFRNAVDGVRPEPDNHRGQVSTEHCRDNGSGTVQIQWDSQGQGQTRRDNI